MGQHRAGAVDQQRAQVGVAALADAQELDPSARPRLSRHLAGEGGFRVAGKLNWLHTAVTDAPTWLGLHAKRGKIAFADFALLYRLKGTLVHDGWASYRELTCAHALYDAHHLRAPTFVHEECGQAWAKRMIDPLVAENILAEQAIRIPKVKHKIAGCFRTTAGAQSFCTIRSYLATLQKQHFDLFQSLVQVFKGNTPQPRFSA